MNPELRPEPETVGLSQDHAPGCFDERGFAPVGWVEKGAWDLRVSLLLLLLLLSLPLERGPLEEPVKGVQTRPGWKNGEWSGWRRRRSIERMREVEEAGDGPFHSPLSHGER